MEVKSKFVVFGVIFAFLIIFPMVSAQLGIPHQFYGTVTYNGAAASNGMSVVAKIDGIVVKETTTVDGKYGYNPLFFITDSDENREGKTIVFYVSNIEASSFIFRNGLTTELNLAVSSTTPPSGGGSSGGGGGGSSGGGITYSPSSSSSQETCVENWQCSAWSNLDDECGTRSCNDLNKCGTTQLKPETGKKCPSTNSFSLTGAVTGVGDFVTSGEGVATFGGMIAVIVASIAIISIRKKKGKTKSSEFKKE